MSYATNVSSYSRQSSKKCIMFIVKVNKVNVGPMYSAVYSPLERSKRCTLFASPDRPIHSDTKSASPGSILAILQLRDYSLTFPPPSVAYSCIQLLQLGHR